MKYEEWLAGLQTGDEVIIRSRYTTTLARVDRTTANFIIVGRQKYNRNGGHATGKVSSGHAYGRAYLWRPTDELRCQIALRELTERLARVRWNEQPLSVLQAVSEIVLDRPDV